MKKIIIGALLLIAVGALSFYIGRLSNTSESEVFQLLSTPTPTPLARYTIDNISTATIQPADFTKGEELKNTKDIRSYLFGFSFDPTLKGSEKKTVSGVVNMPLESGVYPLVVMVRGYVDPNIYTPGMGSKNAAEYFAQNGFVTVAPDFLGYASSDTEAGNVFESRFQTYTTMVTLLESLATPSFSNLIDNSWDGKNVFIWAHSNGGQITLTSLAITGLEYPATLWAPVTKPFPYNVLYYTDESADGGKFIRRELAKFENIYNVDSYTFTNYLDRIKAPLQVSQGTADDAIQFEWTRAFTTALKKSEHDVIYNEYPGADHNLRPAWNTVVAKDIEFFKKWMK